MGKQLFANNATTTMSGTLAIGGTTLNVAAGTGSVFPSIDTAGDYFLLTLFTKDAGGVELNYEIAKVTARTGDALTIERDYEGLVGSAGGRSYDGVADTVYVQLRWTAGGAEGLQQMILDGIPSAGSANPAMDGTAAPGTSAAFSREDHVHPTDISRAPATTGVSLLKANGSGGFTNAVANTDYQTPLSAGLDYQIPLTAGSDYQTPLTPGVDYLEPGGALGTPSSGNLGNCTFPTTLATTGANTFSGAQNLNDHDIENIKTATFPGESAPSATAGAIAIDFSSGQNYAFTPTGNVTGITFTAPPGVGRFQIRIPCGSTVYTITWPASNFYWLGETWDGLTANKSKFVTIFFDGTNYWATHTGQV